MIEPSKDDIGRIVLYTGNRYPGGKTEEGVITSFNDVTVFVRYAADKHSKGTSRGDLIWAMPRVSKDYSNSVGEGPALSALPNGDRGSAAK